MRLDTLLLFVTCFLGTQAYYLTTKKSGYTLKGRSLRWTRVGWTHKKLHHNAKHKASLLYPPGFTFTLNRPTASIHLPLPACLSELISRFVSFLSNLSYLFSLFSLRSMHAPPIDPDAPYSFVNIDMRAVAMKVISSPGVFVNYSYVRLHSPQFIL